jgi:hypothetical protein
MLHKKYCSRNAATSGVLRIALQLRLRLRLWAEKQWRIFLKREK